MAFLEHRPLFGAVVKKDLEHAELKGVKEWHKPLPSLHAGALCQSLQPCASMEDEFLRATAQVLLYEKVQEFLGCRITLMRLFQILWCCVHQELLRLGDVKVVLSTMNQLFADNDYNKGGLVLLPCGPVQLLPSEKVAKHHAILKMNGMGNKFVLQVVPSGKCDFEKKAGHFIPFFFVKEAAEGGEFCMAKAHVKHKDVTIPCWKNTKALVKGQALLAEPVAAPKKKAKNGEK